MCKPVFKTEQYDDHLRIEVEGKPGYITVKAGIGGFIVDIWPDVGNDSDASTYSMYRDLENDHD
jgi:hypothetical protein